MTLQDNLAAIRKRDAEMEYWQVTGGSAVCTDRRALLDYVDTLTTLVCAQAEDAGLWFRAETAAEAYLQQALRRLHRAVEGAAP